MGSHAPHQIVCLSAMKGDTLVRPLGRCVGASDHTLFLFDGCVMGSVHSIRNTSQFTHYNAVVMSCN